MSKRYRSEEAIEKAMRRLVEEKEALKAHKESVLLDAVQQTFSAETGTLLGCSDAEIRDVVRYFCADFDKLLTRAREAAEFKKRARAKKAEQRKADSGAGPAVFQGQAVSQPPKHE